MDLPNDNGDLARNRDENVPDLVHISSHVTLLGILPMLVEGLLMSTVLRKSLEDRYETLRNRTVPRIESIIYSLITGKTLMSSNIREQRCTAGT